MGKSYLKYVKNLTTYFGASLIPMALGIITNPLIASNMSPTDYAITGYFSSFNALIKPVIVFYMVHYFIKEFFQRDKNGRYILFAAIAKMLIWFSAVVSIICFVIILIYLKFISKDFSLPISPYLGMSVFCIPLCGLFNLIQARQRMDRDSASYFRLTVSSGILNIALSLIFVVIIKWGAFGKLFGPLIANIGVFLYLNIKYKKEIFIKTPQKEYLNIFKFCWPLTLSAMLGYFTDGFDRTYLETLGDNTTYGYYIVGTSIAVYLSTFSSAVYNTFQPDLYENIIKRNWKKYFKIIFLLIGSVSCVVGLFILLAPYIIGILTAFRYLESVSFARIISLSTITSTMYFILNDFTITINRPKVYLYTSILGSLLVIFLMKIMVERFAFYGGAWMKALSFIGFSIINLIILSVIFTYRKNRRQLA